MDIKILGTGCAKCRQLEKITREALAELGIDASIEDVREINEIMAYPILATPGLVINGELVAAGKVPSKAEIAALVRNAIDRKISKEN